MANTLKHISPKQLASFFPSYKGTRLTSFPKLPMYFHIKNEGDDMYLTREFLYSDFKEAFPHFALLAKSCSKLQYYPEIFNVYNKVIVKCYTERDGKKIITTKDLFVSFLLN